MTKKFSPTQLRRMNIHFHKCLIVCIQSAECLCQPGYTGEDCEIDIDECENHKCQNNATCLDVTSTDVDLISVGASYFCDCDDGFQGEFCEENIDDCQNHGCENNGECIDGIGTFSCVCSSGFTGRLCEDEIDECSSDPCQSGSTCVDGIGKQYLLVQSTSYNLSILLY